MSWNWFSKSWSLWAWARIRSMATTGLSLLDQSASNHTASKLVCADNVLVCGWISLYLNWSVLDQSASDHIGLVYAGSVCIRPQCTGLWLD